MKWSRDLDTLIKIRPRQGTMQLSRGRTSLVTNNDGEIERDRPVEGLYVYNTRVLSRYAWLLNGTKPALSCSSNVEQFSSLAYYIQTPENCFDTPAHECNPLQETLELRVARSVGEGMHEDVRVTNYTRIATPVTLELQFEIDFVSQSEVEHQRQQYGNLRLEQSQPEPGVWELAARYRATHHYSHQGESGVASLDRGLTLRIENTSSAPQIANDRLSFQAWLEPHREWHVCLSWLAEIHGQRLPSSAVCIGRAGGGWDRRRDRFLSSSTSFVFPHSNNLSATVHRVLERSKLDMESLRLHDLEGESDPEEKKRGIPFAAGIPTYQEIFGRDMEAAAWQAAILSPEFVRGALNVLNQYAVTERNDRSRSGKPMVDEFGRAG